MVPLPPKVKALFEGKNFGHLATLMPDGSPQVTPVWVDVDGDNILVNTEENRAKPRNVRRDPRVSISIVNQQVPYQAAFVRGKVIEVRKEGAKEHIDFLARKYTGADVYPAHNPKYSRLIFVIEPEHVSTMGLD
jgi:PPOX class probable F420-dependent enzyme